MIEVIAQSMYKHNFCDIPDARYLAGLVLPDIEEAGMLPPYVQFKGVAFYQNYPKGPCGVHKWEENMSDYDLGKEDGPPKDIGICDICGEPVSEVYYNFTTNQSGHKRCI